MDSINSPEKQPSAIDQMLSDGDWFGAVERVARDHRLPSLMYLQRKGCDRDDCEDLFQDIFLKFWQISKNRPQTESHLVGTWYISLAHLVIGKFRSSKPFISIDNELFPEGFLFITALQYDVRLSIERDALIDACWEKLSPREQGCLDRRIKGMDNSEIAQELEITTEAVSVFCCTGTVKLKKCVSEKEKGKHS